MRRPKITPELITRIARHVRNGAFAEIAAQACGVKAELYQFWAEQARKPGKSNQIVAARALADAVEQAHGEARVKAEKKAWATKPLIWLRNGPGKEKPGTPGWSISPKPAEKAPGSINLTLNPQYFAILNTIMAQLEEFPDAKARVAAALDEKPAI